MRAFLAFELEGSVKEYLDRLIREMAKTYEGVRWVKKENHHVTIKFFEDLEEGKVEAMRERLLGVAEKFDPFEVTTGGIEFFPDRRRARVIVVSLEEGAPKMGEIFGEVERRLSGLGIEEERRPYRPHITLGRRRVPSSLEVLPDLPLERRRFRIERMALFKSMLSPQGPLYTALWHIRLGIK